MSSTCNIQGSSKLDLNLVMGATFTKSLVYKEGSRDLFSGDGVVTTFTLSTDLTNQFKIKLDGVIISSAFYSISYGTGGSGEDQVIFTTAPPTAYENISIEYVSPFDFTDYEGDMEIRTGQRTISVKFTFGPPLSGEDGTITLGPERGKILIYLGYLLTTTIDFKDGKYDLFVKKTDNSDKRRIIHGYIVTDFAVTR